MSNKTWHPFVIGIKQLVITSFQFNNSQSIKIAPFYLCLLR